MNKPRFSIIVGAYNQAKVIDQLAESMNRQTFRDFEVHLCDDGSDDYTDVAFRASLRPNTKVFFHRQEQRGMRLAKNLNQGIRAANGEYCVFVMGDSFMDDQYLEVLNEFVAPHRILCGVRYQVDHGVGVDVDWRLKKSLVPPENVLLPNHPYKLITGNGLVIPTEAMRLHGFWNERLEGYGGEDYEIVANLFFKGYTVWSIIDAKLYHNWHKAKESNPESIKIVQEMLHQYAGVPL